MEPELLMQNPHLEGGSFLWSAGRSGVLLLHGYTATTAEVRLLAKALHQKGYTVAGPLLPGHGTTPEDANRAHWQQWVGTAEAAYRQLAGRCDQVVVGGESMGASIALYLASQHPEIAAVLAYAPFLMHASPVVAPAAWFLAPFVPYQVKAANPITAADAYWQGYRVNPVRGVRELFHFQRIVRRRLHLVRRPLLLVQGRLDRTVHPGVPELLKSSVASSVVEVHWMEKSGHCVILDQEWEQVTEITLEFLHKVLD
jgi:carboxylesterase